MSETLFGKAETALSIFLISPGIFLRAFKTRLTLLDVFIIATI